MYFTCLGLWNLSTAITAFWFSKAYILICFLGYPSVGRKQTCDELCSQGRGTGKATEAHTRDHRRWIGSGRSRVLSESYLECLVHWDGWGFSSFSFFWGGMISCKGRVLHEFDFYYFSFKLFSLSCIGLFSSIDSLTADAAVYSCSKCEKDFKKVMPSEIYCIKLNFLM